MIITIILLLVIIAALGTSTVCLWLQRKDCNEKLREETDKRWDEISRSAGIENELERSKAREKCSAEAVQWYADQLMDCERKRRAISKDARALRDHLSAILCPTNNHVWRDGVCTKCGRKKDD